MSVDATLLFRVLSAFNKRQDTTIGQVVVRHNKIVLSARGFCATIVSTTTTPTPPTSKKRRRDDDGGDADAAADEAPPDSAAAAAIIQLSTLVRLASQAKASAAAAVITLCVVQDGGALSVVSSNGLRATVPAAADKGLILDVSQLLPPSGTTGIEVDLKWLAGAIKNSASEAANVVRIGVRANELFIEGGNLSYVKPVTGIAPVDLTYPLDALYTITHAAACTIKTGVLTLTSNGVFLHVHNDLLDVRICCSK